MPNWKYPCRSCHKPVKVNQRGLQCELCLCWQHLKCQCEITVPQYEAMKGNTFNYWLCCQCNANESTGEECTLESTADPAADSECNNCILLLFLFLLYYPFTLLRYDLNFFVWFVLICVNCSFLT